MVTKVVDGVDGGATELHLLVRQLAPVLASSWVFDASKRAIISIATVHLP